MKMNGKRYLSLMLVVVGLAAADLFAQSPDPGVAHVPAGFSLGAITPTADMWYFEQERIRRDDPREMIREKAEFKARQRQQRIAALKWFGLSNSRPQASPSLFGMNYSPGWVGNTYDPFAWRGTSATTTVLYSDSPRR
jgi:hypothetical protein